MKKILYGTSALVSAGLLAAAPAQAEKIKVGVGGYMNTFFSLADIDQSAGRGDYNDVNGYQDGEIHVKGETALDNGLTIGIQVDIEVGNRSPDYIDENYIYLKGDFGRLILGSENTAAYMMQISAPNVGVPINSGWVTAFIPPATANGGGIFRAPGGSTYGDIQNDENNMTYMSPRVSGFQFGVSYVPESDLSGEGNNQPTIGTNKNGVSLGLNFVQDFGGANVGIAGGYRTIDVAAAKDITMYSAGVSVGFAGFTIGGSWLKENSARNTDGRAFDIGVSYATGPWSVGVNAIFSKVEGTAADTSDDEMTAIKGAVAYSLGGGATASFSLMYADWEVETSESTAGTNDGDQSGLAGIVGIALSF